MRTKTLLAGTLAIVVVGGWYAFRPERLFVNNTVNEAVPMIPTSMASESMTGASMPGDSIESGSGPMTLAAGRFHSNAHETSGRARVLDLGGGRRVLRLSEFSTSNGPDVRVYLVAAPDVNDDATVAAAGFVELGTLKGNRGDQNYEVPPGVDLAKYRTVTIWCKRFSVNFGSAPLAQS